MPNFSEILKGDDLRSIGNANVVVDLVNNQNDFNRLLDCLFISDRNIVMRAADALEKISHNHPNYLQKNKTKILQLSQSANNKELKWHLAILISLLKLSSKELIIAWKRLSDWAKDKNESKIVRVNAIQGLYNLLPQIPELNQEFNRLLIALNKENIASLNARIKKLQKIFCCAVNFKVVLPYRLSSILSSKLLCEITFVLIWRMNWTQKWKTPQFY